MNNLLANTAIQHCLGTKSYSETYKGKCTEVRALKAATDNNYSAAQALSLNNLYFRDMHICQYCGVRYDIAELSYDYVIPLQEGGVPKWTNTVTVCQACKIRKSGRTPEKAGMSLLTVPYVPVIAEYLVLRKRKIKCDEMMTLYRKSTDKLLEKQAKGLSYVGGPRSESGCSSSLLL